MKTQMILSLLLIMGLHGKADAFNTPVTLGADNTNYEACFTVVYNVSGKTLSNGDAVSWAPYYVGGGDDGGYADADAESGKAVKLTASSVAAPCAGIIVDTINDDNWGTMQICGVHEAVHFGASGASVNPGDKVGFAFGSQRGDLSEITGLDNASACGVALERGSADGDHKVWIWPHYGSR